MIQNPHSGKFVILAGCDGSGKDTQARRLEKALTFFSKVKVLQPFPKEPTKGPIGTRIYEILFGRDPEFKLGENLSDMEFQKFFIRDRIEHYRGIIIPALNSGMNVICNRGIDSTLVYGGNTKTTVLKIIRCPEEKFA